MIDPRLSWRIEEVCFRAYPAIEERRFGNWLFRFSDGMSRRANSVNPLVSAATDIKAMADMDAMLAAAEQAYRSRGLPAIVRVPSIVAPALDSTLAAHGYAAEGESCVLHCALDDLAPAPADPELRLLASPTPEWLDAMAQLQGHSPAQRAAYRRIVQGIAVPARFALLARDNEPAALAFGAVHDGMLCYESVIVAAEQRQQGLGRRLVASLAAWGRTAGATAACLQVEAGNSAGRALYDRVGLRELYRYHYRRNISG